MEYSNDDENNKIKMFELVPDAYRITVTRILYPI